MDFGPVKSVVAAAVVPLVGAWETVRRGEAVESQFRGLFESASPLVGLGLISLPDGIHWVKSRPPSAERPELTFSLRGWTPSERAVSVSAAFQGVNLPNAFVEHVDEPPRGWALGGPQATTGMEHVVVRRDDLVFSILLLLASDVKVGRNRLWHLRQELAAGLPPALREIMTKRRTGRIDR